MPFPSISIILAGHVVDGRTGMLLAGLRLEICEGNQKALETATTDAHGLFRFDFSPSRLRKLFGDRRPKLSIRVFRAKELIHTKGAVAWQPIVERTYLRIEADLPLKEKSMPPLSIRSHAELIAQQKEIIERIAATPHGGHLLLLEPFQLFAQLRVELSPEARAEILRYYPGLSALSLTAYNALRGTRRRQSIRFHVRSIAPRRSK